MTYLFYIFFALAPSLIWLLFFLRKDKNPESKRMILIVFILGTSIALPAALIEICLNDFFQNQIKSQILCSVISAFLGIALIEELAKYSILKFKVFKNSEFDEPVDVMIYMIVAALGFAAAENIILLFGSSVFNLFETATISMFRFVGATFLHALCSATLGYFIAISVCFAKNKIKVFSFGLFLIVFLHGAYNLSIISIDGNGRFTIPIIILIGLTIFVHWGFRKLKKLKSICKIYY